MNYHEDLLLDAPAAFNPMPACPDRHNGERPHPGCGHLTPRPVIARHKTDLPGMGWPYTSRHRRGR